MSRTSTSSTSSSRPNPSPPVSVPLLSHTSPPELPSFGTSAMDDFVLFPEDNTSWNPADLSIPEFDENLDLSQFNFDISGLDNFSPMPNTANQPFDFSYIDQQPFVPDQYGLDSWASAQGGDLPVSHTRPHNSLSSNDSGQLDSSFDSGFLSTESPGSLNTPQSSGSFAEDFWPDGSVAHPQIAQLSSVSLPSAEVDWSSGLESYITATSPAGDLPASSWMNRRGRRHVERVRSAAIQAMVDGIPSTNSLRPQPFVNPFEQLHNTSGSLSDSPTESWYDQSQSQSPGAANGGSLEYWDLENGLENTRALVVEATQALKSTGGTYQPIFEELQRLQVVLANVKSGDAEGTPDLRQALVSELESLTSQLHVLLTRVKNILRSTRGSMQRYNRLDPEYHPDHLTELSVQTRRLVSSLCATINNLPSQNTGTGDCIAVTNTPVLSSGNVQLAVSPSSPPSTHPQDAGVYMPKGSYSGMSSGSLSNIPTDLKHAVILRDGKTVILDDVYEGDGFSSVPGGNLSGNVAIATIDKPLFRLVAKPAIERLSLLVDRQSEQTDKTHVDVGALASALTSPNQLSSLSASTLAFSRQLASTQEVLINVSSDTSRDFSVGGLQQESNPAILTEHILPRQQTDPTILADQDGPFVLRRPIPSTLQVLSVQNSGRSGSESLVQNESTSPGAIPRTLQDTSSTYSSGIFVRSPTLLSGYIFSYMAILASLVLLNVCPPSLPNLRQHLKSGPCILLDRDTDKQQYLQATFILPLAALFLAIPRPELGMVAVVTMAVVVAQTSPLSDLMSGLRSFVTLALMFIPLIRESAINNGSFGKALSVCSPLCRFPLGNLCNRNPPSLYPLTFIRPLSSSSYKYGRS